MISGKLISGQEIINHGYLASGTPVLYTVSCIRIYLAPEENLGRGREAFGEWLYVLTETVKVGSLNFHVSLCALPEVVNVKAAVSRCGDDME